MFFCPGHTHCFFARAIHMFFCPGHTYVFLPGPYTCVFWRAIHMFFCPGHIHVFFGPGHTYSARSVHQVRRHSHSHDYLFTIRTIELCYGIIGSRNGQSIIEAPGLPSYTGSVMSNEFARTSKSIHGCMLTGFSGRSATGTRAEAYIESSPLSNTCGDIETRKRLSLTGILRIRIFANIACRPFTTLHPASSKMIPSYTGLHYHQVAGRFTGGPTGLCNIYARFRKS
jgi:hypothetical protein